MICPATFPLKKIRQTFSCNIELLLNKKVERNYCQIILKELRDTYWKNLIIPGHWVYTAITREPISIKCPHSTQHAEIEDSGIINIRPGCKIRAKTATMSCPIIQTMKIMQLFTPYSNLSIHNLYEPIHQKYQINLTDAMQEAWISNHSNTETTFQDIIEKAQQIKNRRIQDWKISTYNNILCSIGVLGMALVIAVTLYQSYPAWKTMACVMQLCCRRNKETQEPSPHPAPENKSSIDELQHNSRRTSLHGTSSPLDQRIE